MRFAILGRTQLLIASAKACIAAGHAPALVATSPIAGHDVDAGEFEKFAKYLNVPFHSGKIDQGLLSPHGADIAISINWPSLLEKPVRDVFRHGILNAHAGDLPRYRGNACPNWAIINGEKHVGVCIHRMIDDVDAGPVYSRERLRLNSSTYVSDVYKWLDVVVPQMFAKVLSEFRSIKPKEQDHSRTLRCYPRIPEDGLIDWRQPAERIARLVRASSRPFAGAYSFLDARKLTIWRARAEPLRIESAGVPGQVISLDQTRILTGDGALVIEEYAPARAISSTRMRLRS